MLRPCDTTIPYSALFLLKQLFDCEALGVLAALEGMRKVVLFDWFLGRVRIAAPHERSRVLNCGLTEGLDLNRSS